MKRGALLGLALAFLLGLVSGPSSAEVVRAEGHYTYYGLAADTKPSNPQAGDRFVETDGNGKVWEYSGSAWVQTYVNTTFGSLVPCEILGINRCAVVNHDDCTVISAAGTTNALKTGAGSFARINYMSGTAVSVKLYDALTVTGTAFYDNSAIGVTPSTGFLPPTVHIGRALSTGLTVVVAGTNPMVQLCYL